MNSILQCFGHIPELYNYFKKDKMSNLAKIPYFQNNQLFPVFREVLMELWNTSNIFPYIPINFKTRLGEMNPLFKGPYPNDAKDLLTFILMQIHEELNNPSNNNLNENYINNNIEIQKNKKLMFNNFRNNFMNNYRSIISDLFFGIIYSKSECNFCKINLYNYELFNFLTFPLENILQYKKRINNYNNNYNYSISIEDCFQYSQLTTKLNNYYCIHCNRICQCDFTTYVSILPNIIVIILERGVENQSDIKITFEENIKLNNYVEFLKDDCMYELIGVVTYYRKDSNNGHFVAKCISPIDGKWYLYNDSKVKEIGYFNKDEFYEGYPYILFYKKFRFK